MDNQQIQSDITLDSIEDAIEAIRNGEVIVVVDDADRENEGDFICAAECISPEIINFMIKEGRGLVCAPITGERAEALDLQMMVSSNTELHETAFTISVDLTGYGCTTGISAQDRAKTIQALTNPAIKAHELARPGHIFPLIAKEGGVLRRTGHTEAAIDLARLAGLYPAGVVVEILNEDGSMARVPDLLEIAERLNLKMISIEDLVAYRMRTERIVETIDERLVQTEYGEFRLQVFRQSTTGDIHMALSLGTWEESDEVLVRVHSQVHPSDLLGVVVEGMDKKVRASLALIKEQGRGALIYMHHQDKERSLEERTRDYLSGNERKKAASMEQRDFGTGAQIIRHLGIRNINLITNRPVRRVGLEGYGLQITQVTSF